MNNASMIIFGGTKGIGKKLASHYANNGFKVSVASRHPQALGIQNGINVIMADVIEESSVEAVFVSHVKMWGQEPSVVINCAGIQGPIGYSWTIPTIKIVETIKSNLLGSFIVAKLAVNRMMTIGSGCIVMFSGGGSVYARPNFNAYAISKAGVIRMVENIAEELALAGISGITINAVAPGAVKTQMTEEVIKADLKAGEKGLNEALETFRTGGTSLKQITDLIDFLIHKEINHGLTGRLIHVRENYRDLALKYGKNVPEEIGKSRRITI